MKILGSASKITLIILAVTACIAFLLRIMPVDQFMILAIAVFSYYFAKPLTPDTVTTTSVTKSNVDTAL